MEGSLELELNKSKLKLIGSSFIIALFPMILFSFGLAFAFQFLLGTEFRTSLLNAIPLAVISSAIAIPSARNLNSGDREFITYESSLSDIFGVIFFNFVIVNEYIDGVSVGLFFSEILIMIVVSLIATLILAFLLSRIRHHVKFIPIILLIIMIYYISKIYHLPALIFILFFGLFIGNLDEFKRFTVLKWFRPEVLNREVHKFKHLIAEITFIIRALFFLLFGYLINMDELLHPESMVWAVSITSSIFILRAILLKLFKIRLNPLLFLAPRGLITILLFLLIPAQQSISLVNKSLIVQIIILSAIIMMLGLMSTKKNTIAKPETEENPY